MRTTLLPIDVDVAARLERSCKQRTASLKDLANEALRRALRDMKGVPKRRDDFARFLDLFWLNPLAP